MQLALPSDSSRSRLVLAGVALVGASLIAVNPGTPTLPEVQHRAVQLTSGELDWSQVVADAETNLQTLETEAATADSDLSSALSTAFGGDATQFSTALSDFETNFGDIFDGGWYGGDDGYVFGLFGGTVTDPTTGVSETGSTLQEISTALESGNLEQAYTYFDTWSLESLDHTLRYLVEPVLSDTSQGVTTPSLTGELLQTFTNVYNEFATYSNLKDLGDAALSPQISFFFGLTGDLDNIASEFASGDTTQALSDLSNLSSDVTGDLLNGFVPDNPIDGSTTAFTGLLNSGSLLDDLLVTWPTALATALTETTTTTPAEAVTSSIADILGGL